MKLSIPFEIALVAFLVLATCELNAAVCICSPDLIIKKINESNKIPFFIKMKELTVEEVKRRGKRIASWTTPLLFIDLIVLLALYMTGH